MDHDESCCTTPTHGDALSEPFLSPLHSNVQGSDDGGAARKGRPRRSAANRSILCGACVLWAVECTVAAGLMPFFPRVAAKAGGGAVEVGYVFAVFPLATALASPLVPWCCRGLGSRVRAIYVGLVLTVGGLIGFAYATTIPAWIAWRAAQGVACALVDVPATALLLTHSADVAEDTGILEAVAGVAYMGAPALGGALYQVAGFEATFVVLAALNGFVLLALPRVLRAATRAEDDRAREAGGEAPAAWAALASATVVWSMVSFCLSNASLSFYDAALAVHLRATLGFGALATGLVYLVPSAIYAGVSPFAGRVIRRYGARNPLILGCGLWTLASFAYGPLPLAAVLERSVPVQRAFAYASLGLWSVASGVAIALVYQTPLPLARNSLGRDVPPALDDALAALQQASSSLGQVFGPVIGGAVVQYGYKWDEPGCALEEAGACRSGFFTASSLFALLFAVVTPCLFAFVTSDRPSADAPLAPIGSPWGLPRTPRRSRRPGGGDDSDDEDAASRDTVTV